MPYYKGHTCATAPTPRKVGDTYQHDGDKSLWDIVEIGRTSEGQYQYVLRNRDNPLCQVSTIGQTGGGLRTFNNYVQPDIFTRHDPH